MNIGFIIGSPGISGGSYVIYEHASRLKRRGHRVVMLTRQEVRPEEHAWHASAGELEWKTLRQAQTESFDVAVATWWETLFLLRKLQATHCVYFVQSIESRFFEPTNPLSIGDAENSIWRHLCEKTYSCSLPMITEAAWIQNYIQRNHNNWPHLVRNGIRKDIYAPDGPAAEARRPDCFRVLVEGPVEVFFKNVPTAIRLAREAGADEVWLLTSSAVREQPGVDRVFSRLPIHQTPNVYRSCDLILKLSYVEGMFGPPLEMFHCGGTALVYDVTGHDEYIVHDRNAYVVRRDDEQEVVRLLRRLKEDPEELARLKQGAAETAAAWPDWEECAGRFEQVLQQVAAGRPVSRHYLKRHAREMFSLPTPYFRARMQKQFADRERADWEGEPANRNNFVRLFWDGKGKFSSQHSQWQHCLSGEWTSFSFELRLDELPLWLRLDPTSRIGIVEIDFVVVRNKTRDRTIMAFREPDDFRILFLDDMKWLFPERKNIVFAYGRSFMLLPTLQEDAASVGDLIEVSGRVRETGMQQFFDEQRFGFVDKAEEDAVNGCLMRLFWDCQGQFSKSRLQRQPYPDGEWTEVCFELRVDELPLWLRIDPCISGGIVEIDAIVVRNKTQDRDAARFADAESFALLLLAGDLQWLSQKKRNVLLASGPEPILILPAMGEEVAAVGDVLEVLVRLRRTGMQEFLSRHEVGVVDRNASRWQKLRQLLGEFF